MSFYSKLVRLKVAPYSDVRMGTTMFLFQTGSIKSAGSFICRYTKTSFLFQTGSIKSRRQTGRNGKIIGFLFQTGSIKRNKKGKRIAVAMPGFYSKLVRLKGKINDKINRPIKPFLFQTGSIKSQSPTSDMICA